MRAGLPASWPVSRMAALAMVLVFVPLAWMGSLDGTARDYVESGLKRALVTFAAARTANAVISVIQETTVAVAPGGLGVTTSPGQVLDPVNDLIEQFSTLMLAASVSLGVQLLLISVAGVWLVSAVVTVALLGWAAWAWSAKPMPVWLPRLLVLALFVRFAVPVAALASEGAYRLAMASQYREAQAQVDATSGVLLGLSRDSAGGIGREGLVEWTRRWWSDEKRSVSGRIDELKARAEELVRHVVTLAAVFVVQTMVLPFAFMWLALRVFASATRLSTGRSSSNLTP